MFVKIMENHNFFKIQSRKVSFALFFCLYKVISCLKSAEDYFHVTGGEARLLMSITL